MTIRLIIAYLLNLFDLAMTTYWVNRYGIDAEANPVGRWLYENCLAVPVKALGVGLLFVILYNAVKCRDNGLERSFQWWDLASWVVLVVYGALALYHVALYFMIL